MKKSGFTLIEMIIVIALTVVVLGILYSIFNAGNKVFSDADVKSTLQMEARDIQEALTSIGMQGTGVTDITISGDDEDEHGKYVNKKYSDLSHETINDVEIKGYDKNNEYPKDGTDIISNLQTYDIHFDGVSLSIINNNNKKKLSEHVKSFNVIPEDINESFANASSIEFNIILHQEKAFSNVDYPINVKVTFRNKK